nr:reverse transcriptase domain-containing protein [Tanacetum cinerariifolium]
MGIEDIAIWDLDIITWGCWGKGEGTVQVRRGLAKGSLLVNPHDEYFRKRGCIHGPHGWNQLVNPSISLISLVAVVGPLSGNVLLLSCMRTRITFRRRRGLIKRLETRSICSESESLKPRRGRSESPRKKDPKIKMVFKRLEKGVFQRLGDKRKKKQNLLLKNIITKEHPHEGRKRSQKVKIKCIKDPVEIHNIKQSDEESTEEFVQRYKFECRDVKGAPECMKILGFMHGITKPELIKRLHDKIPKLVDEMMRVTTTFFRGEVAASNRERKKSFPSWKQQEARQKKNFKRGGFRNQQRSERKQRHVYSPYK